MNSGNVPPLSICIEIVDDWRQVALVRDGRRRDRTPSLILLGKSGFRILPSASEKQAMQRPCVRASANCGHCILTKSSVLPMKQLVWSLCSWGAPRARSQISFWFWQDVTESRTNHDWNVASKTLMLLLEVFLPVLPPLLGGYLYLMFCLSFSGQHSWCVGQIICHYVPVASDGSICCWCVCRPPASMLFG